MYNPGMSAVSSATILETLGRKRDELQKLGVRKLGLFGSAVRGQLTDASDLDFVVELTEKSFDRYMDLKFLLEDTFRRSVDLVLIDTIKPALKDRILREVVYVQGL